MYDESKVVRGIEILWDTAAGRMQSVGRDLVALWLDPSLLNILLPLRDELGTELFQLLVAHSSSHGTKEDYETMVSVFADNFPDGFLAWGSAVGVVGWGRFELPELDVERGTARVIVRAPWELVMQERQTEGWGCPFLRGKLIGIFRYALGGNCWADERYYEEDGDPVVEFSLYPSTMTIQAELDRLRVQQASERERGLRAEVDRHTGLLRRSEERLRATLASLSSWVLAVDPRGRVRSQHRPREDVGGVRYPELREGAPLSEGLPSAVAQLLLDGVRRVSGGHGESFELQVDEDPPVFWSVSLSPMQTSDPSDPQVTLVIRDITTRRAADERERELEAQLHQAQKMEAIGQLTGGVAHDFNNLLTAIAGNLELALMDGVPAETQEFLRDALRASQSAAGLTKQLLAVSRKQPLQPHKVDPRQLVLGMEDLLRRTLGERFDLEVVGSAGQWKSEVDGYYLQSAILNLTINARDAMPNGGKITIETGNVRISPEYAQEYAIAPGQYVLVAVSDTGEGMSEEVQSRAFDPFFTTKGLGRGSGLGLAMVYGFVRQSNGHAKIYSEVGVGTTLKLYLPRSTATTRAAPAPAISHAEMPRGKGETVLVVEDDAPVRLVSVRLLQGLGYTTLECGDGEAALEILQSEAKVDLLFTDVVLPGALNGAKLADAANALRPGLRVLYTSGYTENAILHHGRLDANVRLLEKPFTQDTLARRVYAALADEET